MTQPASTPPTRTRGPWPFVIGGCLVLFLCIVLALAVNAVFWSTRVLAGSNAPVPRTGEIQSQAAALPEGSVDDGEEIFEDNGCSGCHSLEAGNRGAGPSLSGISTRAAQERPGYAAEEYLYEAIVAPRAHVVEGFQPGIMPDRYNRLSDQELADLIAFLMEQ